MVKVEVDILGISEDGSCEKSLKNLRFFVIFDRSIYLCHGLVASLVDIGQVGVDLGRKHPWQDGVVSVQSVEFPL